MPNLKFCGCPDDGHSSCPGCEGWSQAEIDRFSCDGGEAEAAHASREATTKFTGFLATLLCDQQDLDTVHEVATNHWYGYEPRELGRKCSQITFTRTAHGLDCRVRQLNAETSEQISEEHFRIDVRPI